MLLNHSDPSKIADALMMDEFYVSFKDAVFFFFKVSFWKGKIKRELRIKRNMKSLSEPGVQPS